MSPKSLLKPPQRKYWRFKCVSDCLQIPIFQVPGGVATSIRIWRRSWKNGTYESLSLPRLIEMLTLWRLADCPYSGCAFLCLLRSPCSLSWPFQGTRDFTNNIVWYYSYAGRVFLRFLRIAIARELRFLLCAYLPYSVWRLCPLYYSRYSYRPSMVKCIVRGFMSDLDGVICPSGDCLWPLLKYKGCSWKNVSFQLELNLKSSKRPEITEDDVSDLRT